MGVARSLSITAALAEGALALGGCGSDTASGAIALPPTSGAADYQLGGSSPPPPGVTVVTRDSTSRAAPDIYSICYVNAFQTQPGASWPPDSVLHTASGAVLVDPGWPDEQLIDISTVTKRADAAGRIARTTDG